MNVSARVLRFPVERCRAPTPPPPPPRLLPAFACALLLQVWGEAMLTAADVLWRTRG
jgi:hypothetical protein